MSKKIHPDIDESELLSMVGGGHKLYMQPEQAVPGNKLVENDESSDNEATR